MSHRPFARAALGTLAAVLAGGLFLAHLPAGAAIPGRELNFTFEGSSLREASGGTALTVRIATNNGGSLRKVAGRGGGTAVAFPDFQYSTPPQAVMTAVDQEGADDLSPGTANFRFGADFVVNRLSQGSSSDNGDNLMQRGLFRSAMQYKLQVDDKRPLCRIKGSNGAVSVRSSRQVESGTWHRATCTRDGSQVVLKVVRLSDRASWTYRGSGGIGSLKAPSASLPLSIGGKVNNRGGIISGDSDQFNGRMDNVFLNVF